jgi:hypothetical protein
MTTTGLARFLGKLAVLASVIGAIVPRWPGEVRTFDCRTYFVGVTENAGGSGLEGIVLRELT